MKNLLLTIVCFLATLQLSNAQGNAERNKVIYREMNELTNKNSLTDFVKYYAESHEIKGFGKGAKASEAYRKMFKNAFPDLQVIIIELIAEGDFVMARCEASGTHKGEINGIPATGKTFKAAHWTINKFDNEGKIIESKNLNDDMTIMQQLGVIK